MSVKTSRRPLFYPATDPAAERNFTELTKLFVEFYPGVWAREAEYDLATGDNSVKPTVPRPSGRIITFQSAAASIFDKGLDSSGNWVFNSSAPCTIRVAFF